MDEILTVIELNELNMPSLDEILQKALEEFNAGFLIAKAAMSSDLLDKKRKQYNAQKILYMLHMLKKQNNQQKLIGITNQDIFIDGMNFVFGLASQTARICIVSLHRLVEHQIPTQKEKERIVKEITHEIGHVYGLQHCTGNCVMAFSNSVSDVDSKNSELCTKCKRIVNMLH